MLGLICIAHLLAAIPYKSIKASESEADGSKRVVCDGTMTRMNLAVRTIASTFFVILYTLAAQQQRPEIPYAPEDKTAAKGAVTITSTSALTSAKGEVPEVRVAVVALPPLVMEQNGSLSGFSIELWDAIAKRLKLETSYQVLPDASALENAMRSKTADLTPTIFITSARNADFDFSYPILDAGLGILVRETGPRWRLRLP